MALVLDKTEYYTYPVYEYREQCPADWWKRGERIGYLEHSKADEAKSELEAEFWRLSKAWKMQTRGSSSITSIVMNPAYLEIISHGEKMIPFILKDLKNKPAHWFIALRILARTSPVKPEDAGNIKKMTEAWLAWGEQNGKLS